jgi:hypothetical protein
VNLMSDSDAVKKFNRSIIHGDHECRGSSLIKQHKKVPVQGRFTR